MSSSPFQLDPDVEQVLREVAQNPDSALLRVNRPKLIRGLFEREPAVGIATAGLTAAERHLVQTRRADVALALRATCQLLIFGHPSAGTQVSRQGAADDRQLAAVVAGVRRAWDADPHDHDLAVGDNAVLARGVLHSHRTALPDVLKLAAIAQRLEPADYSLLYTGVWLSLQEQHRSAVHVLSSILSVGCTNEMRAATATNLGFATHRLQQRETALTWYRRSSEYLPSYLPGVVGRFVVALQLGDHHEALAASGLLEHGNDDDSPELIWQYQAEHARRATFHSHLSQLGRERLPQIQRQVGPNSRKLIDALV